MRANHVSSVGLGHMGQPMALTLLNAAGEKEGVSVFDGRAKRAAPLGALGASQAFSLDDVARPGGVFSMVPTIRRCSRLP